MSQPFAASGYAEAPIAPCHDWIEEQIIRAYVRLVFALDPQNGYRTITIMLVGDVEVRLTELCQDYDMPTFPPFWVELYCRTSKSVVAYCNGYEFDEDEIAAAVELIISAYQRLSNLH
ncbi:hypothetical protein [Microvirga splendida]|uniref:Uncharacterized protein n=1 Tax=Microvirga splendida TaxID=2795727 RepID=A0ABS0XYV4_9HYPH|nr:hypothetical protein [Microvirga splendida]MBJ6125194.1 hypothetical protein [Microvirga splendida]